MTKLPVVSGREVVAALRTSRLLANAPLEDRLPGGYPVDRVVGGGLLQGITPDGHARARPLLDLAIRADSGWAPQHALLAFWHIISAETSTAPKGLPI